MAGPRGRAARRRPRRAGPGWLLARPLDQGLPALLLGGARPLLVAAAVVPAALWVRHRPTAAPRDASWWSPPATARSASWSTRSCASCATTRLLPHEPNRFGNGYVTASFQGPGGTWLLIDWDAIRLPAALTTR
jgi:hypothetical protein